MGLNRQLKFGVVIWLNQEYGRRVLNGVMNYVHAGVSRRTLEYHFRKTIGRAVHAELSRLRLERALSLLAGGSTPVKRLASSVGFTELPNFSRFIKKHTGLSPTAYRARHGQHVVLA
jgi:transcriptional regulator GlxA family with amidase domain